MPPFPRQKLIRVAPLPGGISGCEHPTPLQGSRACTRSCQPMTTGIYGESDVSHNVLKKQRRLHIISKEKSDVDFRFPTYSHARLAK